MKIKVGKKYKTKDDGNVHIYTTIGKNPQYPVVGEYVVDGEYEAASWTIEGKYLDSQGHGSDLVEVHPCADLKHGDPVWVWNCSRGSRKYERKFIGYTDAGAVYSADEDGLVTLWSFGEPA